jgi:hypothetical protein
MSPPGYHPSLFGINIPHFYYLLKIRIFLRDSEGESTLVLGESRELCNSPPEMNEVNEGLSKMVVWWGHVGSVSFV